MSVLLNIKKYTQQNGNAQTLVQGYNIPENNIPEINTPENNTPENDTPENNTLETNTPENNTPQNDTPDIQIAEEQFQLQKSIQLPNKSSIQIDEVSTTELSTTMKQNGTVQTSRLPETAVKTSSGDPNAVKTSSGDPTAVKTSSVDTTAVKASSGDTTAVETSSGDPNGEEFTTKSGTLINLDLPEPVGRKLKRVVFNLSTIDEETPEDLRCYHRREATSGKRRSRIPRYNGTTVRLKDPQKVNFLYKNAASMGSKIPRL